MTILAALWLAGGAGSAAWLAWLDAGRGEIRPALKWSCLPLWPVMLPYCLYLREDVTGWGALRQAGVALLAAWGANAMLWPSPAPPGPERVSPGRPSPPTAAAEAQEAARRGLAHFRLDEFEQARAWFKRCLQLDARNAACRAALLLTEGRQAPAPQPVPDGAEARRRLAMQRWNSGIIYFQKGDYERARAEWKACVEADPENLDCPTGLRRIDLAYGAP